MKSLQRPNLKSMPAALLLLLLAVLPAAGDQGGSNASQGKGRLAPDLIDYVTPDRAVVGLEGHLRVTAGANLATMGFVGGSSKQIARLASSLYDGSWFGVG